MAKSTNLEMISSTSLDEQIDGIVATRAGLGDKHLAAAKPVISPFVIFLFYKAAAITTTRLQADANREVDVQRLRVLRNALQLTTQRWLAGGSNDISKL